MDEALNLPMHAKTLQHSKKVYTMDDALRWSVQIAEAMAYLHCVCKPMIIHRDLKLENITTSGGLVKSKVAKLAGEGGTSRAEREGRGVGI